MNKEYDGKEKRLPGNKTLLHKDIRGRSFNSYFASGDIDRVERVFTNGKSPNFMVLVDDSDSYLLKGIFSRLFKVHSQPNLDSLQKAGCQIISATGTWDSMSIFEHSYEILKNPTLKFLVFKMNSEKSERDVVENNAEDVLASLPQISPEDIFEAELISKGLSTVVSKATLSTEFAQANGFTSEVVAMKVVKPSDQALVLQEVETLSHIENWLAFHEESKEPEEDELVVWLSDNRNFPSSHWLGKDEEGNLVILLNFIKGAELGARHELAKVEVFKNVVKRDPALRLSLPFTNIIPLLIEFNKMGGVYLDIKPDQFLVESKEDDMGTFIEYLYKLHLIDFGLSKIFVGSDLSDKSTVEGNNEIRKALSIQNLQLATMIFDLMYPPKEGSSNFEPFFFGGDEKEMRNYKRGVLRKIAMVDITGLEFIPYMPKSYYNLRARILKEIIKPLIKGNISLYDAMHIYDKMWDTADEEINSTLERSYRVFLNDLMKKNWV